MYLFVYKTTHSNGKYYIGRHQTNNLNDGYLGSGNWVESIKDKSALSREIIAEATSFEELCELEEYHIGLHYGKAGCMNYKRASIGLSSEDASELNKKRVENGTHPFLGPDLNQSRIDNGTHHFLGDRNPSHKRIKDGTHHWVGGEYQKNLNKQLVENGTHHFLGDGEFQRAVQRKNIDNGTHHFLGDRNPSHKRIKDGTHHLLGSNSPTQVKWTCPHCGTLGKGTGQFSRWHGDNCKRKPE